MHARWLSGETDTKHAASGQIETYHTGAGGRGRHW